MNNTHSSHGDIIPNDTDRLCSSFEFRKVARLLSVEVVGRPFVTSWVIGVVGAKVFMSELLKLLEIWTRIDA